MLKTVTNIINVSQITGVLPVVNGGTGVATSTGTGNTVLSASPTFSGTAVFATLNATGVITSGAGGSGATDGTLKLNGSDAANQGSAVRIDRNNVNKAYVGTTSFIIGGASDTPILWASSGLGWDIYVNAATVTPTVSVASTGIVRMSAYGAGTATFSATGVISSVSDETWKIKDGVPTNPDAMLKKLKPGYWYYNNEKKKIFGADRQLGFYAQNINVAIGPEAAPTPEEGKPWGYYDRSVLAVVVMSLQKALATIEVLTARVAQLENKP
tara:strand:+ start:2225 stop:3034 length:810 start_codon:yes stop_codon:yes gene_type:complete